MSAGTCEESDQFFTRESSDDDPLVRKTVAHHQFDAIHPFCSGKGRTERILALVESGLSRSIRNEDEYERRLFANHRFLEVLLADELDQVEARPEAADAQRWARDV